MVSGTQGSKESGQVGIDTGGGSADDPSLLTVLVWGLGRTSEFQSVDQGIQYTVVAGEWLEDSASRKGSSSRSEQAPQDQDLKGTQTGRL